MSNADLIALAEKYVAPTYGRFPVAFVRGEGCRLWDADGREYLDFVSGLAVCSLGHSHPAVTEAIRKQAGELVHVSNLYHIEPQIKLAQRLAENSFADKAFFCNSGTEAGEASIKLARKYSFKKYGEGRHEILTFEQSFHGRTMASLSATGQEKFHKGFSPLLPGFRYLPFDDVESAAAAISDQTCAIMVEPIQGEGGVNVPSDDYLKGLRAICDANDLLLIFDEVQVGMGRTGKLWAHEHFDVQPDVMALAKALGGGTAIGAIVATDKAMAFEPGDHAATFGGNYLATAAACAAMDVTLSPGFLDHVAEMGEFAMAGLRELATRHSIIKEVRGKGLIIGCELDGDASVIVGKALAAGILLISAGPSVFRLLPPLVVEKEMIEKVLEFLDSALGEMAA
ncbi:MAG: aspartate aminotransferase family protein [Nitrospinaceae bacterium]|jgi:acetylornithine/N-succinyldiaminopimelate aminotransferase|nr:aspartate aminotransferase family protein [Nitrospinaceae bacterium]MBT3435973.1 aspartate aminotransferase family protein [Nitrospinaceae bacterium]MBT4431792.1 aspartate aminotransferase family protein [Nitrospinaceae bacterium]MBT5369029.1 aspartate aminotransferase family protein [Nitrospinaceae bacterium]MBT5948249.1 aspartate aminotransferase family protein [Nitrospinaceae bacterium]